MPIMWTTFPPGLAVKIGRGREQYLERGGSSMMFLRIGETWACLNTNENDIMEDEGKI